MLGSKENLKFTETFAIPLDENDMNLFGLMKSSSSRSGDSSSSINVQNKLDVDRRTSSISSIQNDDILDSVLLLRTVVQSKLSLSSSSTSSSQAPSSSQVSALSLQVPSYSELLGYMSTLEQIEQSLQLKASNSSCSFLTEADLLNINQSLKSIESQLNTNIIGANMII